MSIKGEVVTLLGPSGSGKINLIRCLNGLEEYRQGTITFEGSRLIRPKKIGSRSAKNLG
nr:ATP-binding cassette domain-containing protein [Lactiplantibacillus plantarum]